jgi:hypothetical protein
VTVLALENIAPTCPHEYPTPGTRTAIGVAYTVSIDQHMVPLEVNKNTQHLDLLNRMPNLPPSDNLSSGRYLGQLGYVHVALHPLVERPPSVVPCCFLPWRGPWMLLSLPVLQNGCLIRILVQYEVEGRLSLEFSIL